VRNLAALFTVALLIALISVHAYGLGRTEGNDIVRLSGEWQYRWVNSNGNASNTPWKPISHPGNPPGRDGHTAVQFRIALPDAPVRDPALFIRSVDTAVHIKMDGKSVYSYGVLENGGNVEFNGWPWHLVSLPDSYEDKTVTFTVFSGYRDIGLWGDVLLGSRADLSLFMTRRDVPRLLVASALLTISILGLLVFLFGSPRRSYVLMVTITLLMVIRVITDTWIKQQFLFAPLFWEYVEAATSFFIPGLIAFFLSDVVVKPFSSVMKTGGLVYIGTGILGVLGALAGLYPVYSLYLISEPYFALFGLLYVVATAATLRTGSLEAVVLLITFLLMAAVNVHDILVARSVLEWSDTTEHYLLFVFAAGLATVVAMRIAGLHREMRQHADSLARVNESLEVTVAARTRELEEANRLLEQEKAQLVIASSTDELTGLYNRRHLHGALDRELRAAHRYRQPLSVIMLDLDFFKRLNDTQGHMAGDAVLRRVAAIITQELRDIDYAARYGGEEFLVVLPQTDRTGAFSVAERIRHAVQRFPWDEKRSTTISAGVAVRVPAETPPDPQELIRDADASLYRAKESGRNRVC